MDFTILEARSFASPGTIKTSRTIKDYEIDFECASGRMYSYNSSAEQQLSYGDIIIRKPNDVATTQGLQKSYALTLDFTNNTAPDSYSRNVPGPFQPICTSEAILRLEPIIHPTHINEIKAIYQRLCSLPNKNTPIAKELVNELIYVLNAEISKKRYESIKTNQLVTETVINYMEKNLHRHISLDELAALTNLEKSYFLRVFKSETGIPPIEMLTSMRLAKACDLIATTNLNVYQIATECGYNTVSFFISTYKKRYGLTPEAHRHLIKEN